jgi:transcription initiation factor IIE alpha subunit|tara:strand:- start:11555 stop:11761 length:207 start_codon:yes stop_codon:yes gene_type:complete
MLYHDLSKRNKRSKRNTAHPEPQKKSKNIKTSKNKTLEALKRNERMKTKNGADFWLILDNLYNEKAKN